MIALMNNDAEAAIMRKPLGGGEEDSCEETTPAQSAATHVELSHYLANEELDRAHIMDAPAQKAKKSSTKNCSKESSSPTEESSVIALKKKREKVDKFVQSFYKRDRILERICKGKSMAHVGMLQANEALVRREAMTVFLNSLEKDNNCKEDSNHDGKRKNNKFTREETRQYLTKRFYSLGFIQKRDDHGFISLSSSSSSSSSSLSLSLSSPSSSFWRTMLFWVHYLLPGWFNMVIYTVAIVAVQEFLMTTITELIKETEWFFVEWSVFLIGVLISILSGSIWSFTNPEELEKIKFDMHNRRRLGYPDARLLVWFNQHPRVQNALHITGFFCFLFGVSYFHGDEVMGRVDRSEYIIQRLPSLQPNFAHQPRIGESTRVFKLLFNETYGPQPEADDDSSEDHFHNTIDPEIELLKEEGWFVYRRITLESFLLLDGDPSAGILTTFDLLASYAFSAALSLSFLAYNGIDFWEI